MFAFLYNLSVVLTLRLHVPQSVRDMAQVVGHIGSNFGLDKPTVEVAFIVVYLLWKVWRKDA